jgi:hypothetical protein
MTMLLPTSIAIKVAIETQRTGRIALHSGQLPEPDAE